MLIQELPDALDGSFFALPDRRLLEDMLLDGLPRLIVLLHIEVREGASSIDVECELAPLHI